MGVADEQIRISSRVKRELERRKRDDESYNETLERLLDETPTARFEDGFGRWSAAEAKRVRETRRNTTEKRKRRMRAKNEHRE